MKISTLFKIALWFIVCSVFAVILIPIVLNPEFKIPESKIIRISDIEHRGCEIICIEGYKFVINRNNISTQILDSNGNGILCKDK